MRRAGPSAMLRAPMAMRNLAAKPLRSPTAERSHVGLDPVLVEDQASRLEARLRGRLSFAPASKNRHGPAQVEQRFLKLRPPRRRNSHAALPRPFPRVRPTRLQPMQRQSCAPSAASAASFNPATQEVKGCWFANAEASRASPIAGPGMATQHMLALERAGAPYWRSWTSCWRTVLPGPKSNGWLASTLMA